MRYVPAAETVILTDDLQEIRSTADQSLIGYRLKVAGDGQFSPSISCFATTGYPIRQPNLLFEKLQDMEEKLTKGAVVHGLEAEIYFNSNRKQVEIMLANIGQVVPREHAKS